MKQKSKSKMSKTMTVAEADEFLQKIYEGQISNVDPDFVNSVRSVYDNEHIFESLYLKCKDLVDFVEEEAPPPDAELSPELIKRGAQKVCELNRAGLMVFEAASIFNDHIRERYPAAVIESGFELED